MKLEAQEPRQERVPSRLTDPKKIEFYYNLPTEIQAIISKRTPSDIEFDLIRQHPYEDAINRLRAIVHREIVDRASNKALEWERMIRDFREQDGYLTRAQLLESPSKIFKSPTENLSRPSHPHYEGEYGLRLIGAAINNGKPTALIERNQTIPNPTRVGMYDPQIIEIDPDAYDVPTQHFTAYLSRSLLQGDIYFAMLPLIYDGHTNYWDVKVS